MTRLLLASVAILFSAIGASAQARTARVPSQVLGGERIAAILLPVNYAGTDTRYPVLYLLHGGGQDHTAFIARSAFVRTARRNDMIVVMPAADRNYSASPADRQQRYQQFLARELVDWVDANYRTTASKRGRAIGGISQGGGIAATAALRYPDVFGAVGALSPAFSDDAPASPAGDAPTFFYVSCGTADSLLPASRQLARALDARKLPHEYRELPGGDHSWRVWDDQLAVFVDLLAARGGWRR